MKERLCEDCIDREAKETQFPCNICYGTKEKNSWRQDIQLQRVIYSLEGYQRDALRTAGMENKIYRYGNFALGIAGEAGEVADYIKKVLYHGHALDKEVLCKELGDVLWYIATLADTAGLTLEKVARENIAKLKRRYPDGFSQEKSINREGTE